MVRHFWNIASFTALVSGCLSRNFNHQTQTLSESSQHDVAWLAENKDTDSDGDGLSDFQEIHKYFTHPQKADSDEDGYSDGEWAERREFSYSIRNEIEILKPVDITAMQSDYQDAKVLEDLGKSLLVEVIYYPLNTVAQSIIENPNWRQDYQHMKQYLDPTQTSNWDDSMKVELLAALNQAGIHPEQLSDKTLVQLVSAWVMTTFEANAPFVAYFIDFSDGQTKLIPELLPRLKLDNEAKPGFDINRLEDMLQLGSSGKTLFSSRKIGDCTPTAILMATVLRALGIPTRIILTTPVVDPNDPTQMTSVASNISYPEVRDVISYALENSPGWVSHTYNEVYVGHRWVKLNYANLGQNNLDPNFFGLMTHVNTFVDWADGNLGRTWGMRIADDLNGGPFNPPMSSLNQYMSRSLSDHFGAHANMVDIKKTKIKVPKIHKHLTVNGAYWLSDAELHPSLLSMFNDIREKFFLVRFEEYFPEQDHTQFTRFYTHSPRELRLIAHGYPEIIAKLSPYGVATDVKKVGGTDRLYAYFSFLISDEDYASMQAGVPYRIEITPVDSDYSLTVQTGITLHKPDRH